MKKLFLILFLLYSSSSFAKVYTFTGIDGDQNACILKYNSLTHYAQFTMINFNNNFFKVKFAQNYAGLYNSALIGELSKDTYLIAESDKSYTYPEFLKHLDLVTILQDHETHNHVWLCYNLLEQ